MLLSMQGGATPSRAYNSERPLNAKKPGVSGGAQASRGIGPVSVPVRDGSSDPWEHSVSSFRCRGAIKGGAGRSGPPHVLQERLMRRSAPADERVGLARPPRASREAFAGT